MNTQTTFVIITMCCYSLGCATPQKPPTQRLLTLILQRKYKEAEQLCTKPVTSMSQSDGHAYANYASIIQLTKKYAQYAYVDLSDIETQRCFTAAYAQEVAENSRGRYTFFHGQRWSLEWLMSLYSTLYEATTNQKSTTYQFVRFKDPMSLQEQEEDLYKQLKAGSSWNHRRYLFMNASLFGNAQYAGNCSAYYWFANQSAMSTDQLTEKKIFRRCDLPRTLYKKYEKELLQLKQEHQQLTTHGNLLLISLSPHYCQDHVIESLAFNGKSATGKQVTDNLALLKREPKKFGSSDSVVYRLILTRNKTLVPSEDIKIWSFNGVEPAKWKAFCAKRDVLFARIKQDIHALMSDAPGH